MPSVKPPANQQPLFGKTKEVKRTYLTSEKGFQNYCENCPELISKEDSGFATFPIRVNCPLEKCVK